MYQSGSWRSSWSVVGVAGRLRFFNFRGGWVNRDARLWLLGFGGHRSIFFGKFSLHFSGVRVVEGFLWGNLGAIFCNLCLLGAWLVIFQELGFVCVDNP